MTSAQSNSPDNSLTDSPGGDYANLVNISATLATGIDMTTALDAELKFSAIYDIEDGNFDYCYVEASSDGGITWVELAAIFGQGNLSPWVEYNYSLGGFVGNNDVKIRFRFFSDQGFAVDGIYIDDVEIITSDIDNSAPLILHSPPRLYQSMLGDIDLIAETIDVSDISSTTLYYSVDGGSEISVAGDNLAPDVWQYTIPAQEAGAQVEYYIEAIDASSNNNVATTDTGRYIDGNHVFYDNGFTDFINGIGVDNADNLTGAAVRFSLYGNDIVYALIRNYTDQNNPNDDMEFHIWANDNGLPGADLITPFMVTPEANLVETSPMTRIDLSAYAAELSNINGDVFMGYIATGTTFLTQSTPATSQRSYVFDGTNWTLNANDSYHFRLVTTAAMASDDCDIATDLNDLLGGEAGVPQTSPVFNNVDATVGTNDPTEGWECFGEPDGSGSAPSLDNTQWFTFTGDGELYSILTTDCGGNVEDYIDFGDTQIAIYSGTDCTDLIPVACNEDVAGTPPTGPFPAGLDFLTEEGVTYFILVDGFAGSDGDYCIEFTLVNQVTCDDINLNDATIVNNSICLDENLEIAIDGTVVPLTPFAGFIWGIFTEDVSGSENPFNETSFFGTFGLQANEYDILYTHADGANNLDPGVYYMTPIVYGGGVDTVGDVLLASLSFTDGCIITGTSLEVTLLDDYDDLDVTTSSVNETIPGNGEASVMVADGSGEYTYLWSNGETTSTITDLVAETYTVTITDVSGCVDEVLETIVVESSVNTNDLNFDQSIQLSPNPANDQTAIIYRLAEPVDLTLTMTNSIGQVVFQNQIDQTQSGQFNLDLQQFADGVYFVKLNDGKRQSVKQLVINK
ncbi:MAG: T9SS type A sorting domain-containing protein [Saprospiraceae bacterium]